MRIQGAVKALANGKCDIDPNCDLPTGFIWILRYSGVPVGNEFFEANARDIVDKLTEKMQLKDLKSEKII